jgi:hypothetical protein
VTITFGSWAIPAFLTAVIWLLVMARPPEGGSGYYDFDIKGMLIGIVAIIATLLVWLLYFALRFALG